MNIDKISLNLFHARKKIRENDNKKNVENTDNSRQTSTPLHQSTSED